jgi:hypothetical protein
MESEAGCGDNSCIFSCLRTTGGMRTNGGCRCFKNLELNTHILSAIDGTAVPYDNREEIRHLRRSVMVLAKAYHELKKGERL